MKATAIILIVLVLAGVCGIGYLYLNATLTVTEDSCIATDAMTQEAFFSQLKEQVSGGSFVGTLYGGKELDNADQYQFLTYTLTLDNRTFLNAETVEIQITPMQGDVLQLGETQEHTAPAGRKSSVSATILTSRTAHSVREVTVTWYCWGIPFSTKLTAGRTY